MDAPARTLEGLIGEIQDIRREINLFKSYDVPFSELTVQLQQEIAERKKSEENIRESEERFRTLTTSSPVGN